MVIIKCHNCKHVWDYKGNRLKYVNCPVCHYNCMIKKDKISDNDKSLINSLNNSNLSNKIKVLQNKISELEIKVNSIEIKLTSNNVKPVNPVKSFNNNISGKKIICPYCKHSWIYKGSLNVVRCSNCNKRIYLK